MKCAYHFNSPGHDTINCWALKNKIQDIIDNKEIKFDPLKTPNVINVPIPKHDKGVSDIDDVIYVATCWSIIAARNKSIGNIYLGIYRVHRD